MAPDGPQAGHRLPPALVTRPLAPGRTARPDTGTARPDAATGTIRTARTTPSSPLQEGSRQTR